jgi:hypothetical protein
VQPRQVPASEGHDHTLNTPRSLSDRLVTVCGLLKGWSTCSGISHAMTRPKVPPDQRQRTAQACESCKRRKQKVASLTHLHLYLSHSC